MGVWIVPPVAGLIESAVAPEFYVEGVGAIERIGSNVRLYFYARQRSIDNPAGNNSQVVVLKIVRPISEVARALGCMAKIMAPDEEDDIPCAQPDAPKGPHLVK